jgi:hypothetical protein
MDAISSTLSTAASAVSDTVTQGALHTLVGGGDGAGSGEVARFIAKRSTHFVDGFARTCVDATAANVRDASEMLRTTTLNAAIQSEASATSDLPTLERAVKAMRRVGVDARARDDSRRDGEAVRRRTRGTDARARVFYRRAVRARRRRSRITTGDRERYRRCGTRCWRI